MRNFSRIALMVVSATVSFQTLVAQNKFFTDAGENTVFATTGRRAINPEKYRASRMNVEAMKAFLWALPEEKNLADRKQAPVLELPMPGGGTGKFHVWESSIMQPGLAAKFPEIRTFLGQGIDDPYSTIRFDFNPYFGFSAQIISPNGNIYIDPFAKRDVNNYMSYYSKDNKRVTDFVCHVPSDIPPDVLQRPDNIEAGPCRGTLLASYRLAVACTGEYAVAVCAPSAATVPATMAAIVTSVNRVDGVYESELAVRLILIANNDLLVSLNGATDPYTNTNPSNIMLTQNQTNINAVIGSANYDIGHVFSTGGGGVAGVGVVCIASQKAQGVTGTSNPVGDAYDIDYVAHEMGHQFGGLHSFNGITSNCGLQLSSTAAYEVGSGTTIMCYAGICGVDNTQTHSDPFFHTYSFDQIGALVQSGSGASCKVSSATGNNLPQIISMDNNGVSIPISTPFTLTGSAFDPDGDPITYCWEEFDLGPSTLWNGGNANTTSPLFKSRVPKTVGSRTFPDINVILANFPANPPATIGGLKGETMATVARAMKFRLTVRDNKAGGGGVVTGGSGCQTGFTNIFQINTVATPGPFAVTAPNGGESFAGGSSQTVTWNVVTTDQAPISVANVMISLSTDGGLTFPTVLLASTPNDGTQAVTIPGVLSSTARIKVEAVGNIFFDISNQNFSITAPVSAFDFNSPAAANLTCPAIAAPSITLGTTLTGGFSTPINLSASTPPSGTSVSFGTNPLTPGNGTTVTLNNANTLSSGTYTITVTGIAGAITRTRDLSFVIPTGTGPTINTQPATHAACVGSNTSFTVAATGALSYQWQLSTDGGAIFNNIPGANAATFSITGVQITDNGLYRVNVIGQCGTTVSANATLTVETAPSISAQPQSITLCTGGSNTFGVTAGGSNLTYQWQLSTDGGTVYNNIGGAVSSTYLLSGITAGMNNNRYRVIVSGSCTPPATSTAAILTVVSTVAITTQPVNTTACVGSDAIFTVAGSGTGVLYQWQLSTDGGANFNNISGATNPSYTVTSVTAAMDGNRYRAQLSNATCITPGVSNAGILTVNTLPAISVQPQNSTICVGGNTSFSVTASGTTITYQWQVSTSAVPAFTNIGGAVSATFSISSATAGLNGNQYQVVVSGACTPPVTSTPAVLTVVTPVDFSAELDDMAVCENDNFSIASNANSSETINYQWQVSTDGGANFNNVTNGGAYSGATAASLAFNGVPVDFDENQYRVLVSNPTCTAPVTSSVMSLTVHKLPTATLSAPVTSLTPGQTTTITLTPSASTGGTITYQWFLGTTQLPFAGLANDVNVQQTGAYHVEITETWPNDLQCVNESATLTIAAPASDKLYIFPNPNDGVFIVSYYNSSTGSTTRTVSIFDAHGSRVHQEKFTITGPYTLLNMNIKPSGSGIYVVSIRDANGKKLATGKVLIKP